MEESPIFNQEIQKEIPDEVVNTDINENKDGKQKQSRKSWSAREDSLLKQAIKKFGTNWLTVAQKLPSRNPSQCAQRWKRIKPNGYQMRNPWTQQEDTQLLKLMNKYDKNWVRIAKYIPNRTSKQVRERFINKLNPEINTHPFTPEEDLIIADGYKQHGSQWTRIAKLLQGRPENIIKNRFYSYIRKHFFNIENPYYIIPLNQTENFDCSVKEEPSSNHVPSQQIQVKKCRKPTRNNKKIKKVKNVQKSELQNTQPFSEGSTQKQNFKLHHISQQNQQIQLPIESEIKEEQDEKQLKNEEEQIQSNGGNDQIYTIPSTQQIPIVYGFPYSFIQPVNPGFKVMYFYSSQVPYMSTMPNSMNLLPTIQGLQSNETMMMSSNPDVTAWKL